MIWLVLGLTVAVVLGGVIVTRWTFLAVVFELFRDMNRRDHSDHHG